MARCLTCQRRLRSGLPCRIHGGEPAAPPERGDGGVPPVWHEPLGPCLGAGGFAAVYELPAGRVLKVAHADHELARARMRRESEALAAVGAPAAPRHDGAGVLPDGRAWIAMERIAGENLGDLVADGPLPLGTILGIATGIAEALAQVHAAGFVHRDVKPDNIVRRTADGRIVVLDFGLARKVPSDPDDPTRPGIQVGSLEYMPPEQLVDASSVDERADLYALGCVLFELCAGRPPFVGDAAVLERAHAALRPPPLTALAAVPPELAALVHELLAKQPDRRPATARDVISRLRSVAAEPTAHRVRTQSMSVVREGTQPVVLLWAELPRVDRALLATLGARKISVVSQRGRKVLGSVVGAEHADPAGAAIAAARDLAAVGARVALHLDALAVVPRGGARVPTGVAVDQPESWLPAGAWTGIVLTSALATVTQLPTRATPEIGAGFVALAEVGESTQLFGRDALVADLVADAAAALGGAGPGLAILLGDHGEGKSALAASLVPRLGELGARVLSTAVPPPGSGHPAHAALAALAGIPTGAITGPVVRVVGDALRRAARGQPLAIVIDDLQLADHDLYDALEYATLGGETLPLWILGLATPRLDQRRPGFGARAERRRRDRLQPLDEEAAVAMTASLLRPAEYPPLRALRQIAGLARGNPLHLTTLAREIHTRGAVRARENGEYFLDTTKLDTLPPIALGPWLAARELAALSIELAALARVCAVLGDRIDDAELAAVVEVVERRGGATTTIDVDVGLAELASAGILVRGEAGPWAFRQALLQEGVYATTNGHERRAIHEAALEYWLLQEAGQQGSTAAAARIARHAEAAGARVLAAAAFTTLGEHARAEHRALDADQAWQGALRHLGERDVRRGRALLGRARARYQLQRIKDALADLDEALAIAVETSDAILEVETLLEQATALDWSDDHAGSAAAAARAKSRLAAHPHPPLEIEIEVALAEGRSSWRAALYDVAETQLRTTQHRARELGRRDVQVVATLLLATLLVDTTQFDAALDEFDSLIALCESEDDRLHLGSTYTNRSWLWSARGDIVRCADDLRRVIQIARELGQAALERAATYNLAEALLWAGQLEEALRLATRSLAIQRGYGESVAHHWDQLLVARIHAARDDRPALAAMLAELDRAALGPADVAVVELLACVVDGAPLERWRDAITAVADLPVDSRLELVHLAHTRRMLPPEHAVEVRAAATSHPLWSRRYGVVADTTAV